MVAWVGEQISIYAGIYDWRTGREEFFIFFWKMLLVSILYKRNSWTLLMKILVSQLLKVSVFSPSKQSG